MQIVVDVSQFPYEASETAEPIMALRMVITQDKDQQQDFGVRVENQDGELWREGWVLGVPKDQNVTPWDLVRRALNSALADRAPTMYDELREKCAALRVSPYAARTNEGDRKSVV